MALQGDVELSPSGWVRNHTEKILANGTTEGVQIMDRPVILLTTRGVKSGKLRKVPLMRVEHDGRYAIVASLGGAPKHPVWYHNVNADPHVELQDGAEVKDYVAREVTGDEKATWWERAVAAYPEYANYQRKTDRQIPVFVLEPVEA
jgi:deazaflavin-dependent oxidoreductase (nitroreductase family)